MLQKLTKYGKYVIYGAIALVVSFFLFVFNHDNKDGKVTKGGDIFSPQKAKASFSGDDADSGGDSSADGDGDSESDDDDDDSGGSGDDASDGYN